MTDTVPSSPLKRALVAIEELQQRLERAEAREPVAVIGLGCRFPGGVDGPDAFWELLMAGRDGIVEVPPDRWDADAWYDSDREAPGKMNMRRAGFLQGGIEGFDAAFFGIAPREATDMDPQQRLLLEVAWEALENAARPPSSLQDSDCGVFVGLYNNNYTLAGRGSPAPESIGGWSASGVHTSVAAGRLSYFLGLRGPSLAVDTACSSSLVSVHLAVRALQTGECTLALAGGVHLLLAPEAMVASTKLGATATDGRCKTFDAGADGFGHGEGCGILVLKRLSDARRDGDRILAVILGSAVNQDGRSNSLTAPSGPAQEAVIASALERAGIEPRLVGYVEAHGTGTQLGDPIEVEALATVLGRDRDAPLMVGSVKTNLGHLEAAAGVAGLIKAVLCAERGFVPPHLNLNRLNPEIDPGPVKLVIPAEPAPWREIEGRRIAGVSAFGFGGTNAHLILEAAPAVVPGPAMDRSWALPLSARSPEALTELTSRWADWLDGTNAPARDIATTAGARDHFTHRTAVAGADRQELAAALRRASAAETTRPPRIAFLFTGQGSQYPGMARRAYDLYPTFRDALDRCARVLDPALGRPALGLLFGDAPIDATGLAQPLVVAVELALAALWRSWGIAPAAVMGHSLGEYTAAAVAGALTEEEVLLLVAERGRLMQSLPAGGGMLAAFGPVAAVEPLLASFPETLRIAACNGPANTVVSGAVPELDALAKRLRDQGLETLRLEVSHAFHSPLLKPALPGLERAADRLGERRTRLPLVSNLTGRVVEVLDAAHWCAHAERPVRFAEGLKTLQDLGCDSFLEIGPHPVLTALGPMILDSALWIPSLRRGVADDAMLARALGQLYAAGADIDWTEAHRDSGGRKLAAPTYPFQRRRFWLDLPAAAGPRLTGVPLPEMETRAQGSALVYDFYDELTLVSRTYDLGTPAAGRAATPEEEGHLTFGFLPEPVPGFSWVRALFDKEENPGHHALLRSSQRELKDALFTGIDFSRMRRVFDYGCGHAADLCSLALQHPWLELQGYTLSARQVELGTDRIAGLGLEDRVRVHRNDSSTVPFPGSFDLVFGFEVTGLIADKDGLFDNIVGHLAPGGLLVIADFVATGEPIANPETNSFTPSYVQWVDLLSRRRLRLVRTVDASPEVANWLDDPDFAIHVDQLVERFGLGALTRRHLLSNGNIGKALRADLMRYLLLTAQHSPHESAETLSNANHRLLRDARPYRELRGASGAWRNWLYTVGWQPAADPEPLPGAAQLAQRLAAATERERLALEAFGDLGAQLDRLSLEYTVAAFRELGCADRDAAARAPVAQPFQRLRNRLVSVLREQGLKQLPDPGDMDARCARALEHHPEAEAELELLHRCGRELGAVLAGRKDPLQLLFPGGNTDLAERLYEHSPFSRSIQRLAAEAVAALPRGRPLAVLEIGGGTGATTSHLLPELPAGSRYLFTDLGPSLVARAREKFSGTQLEYATLDVSRRPADQGIATDAWDLVIAANVLHATPNLERTLGNVRDLLAPDGLLLLVENTGRLRWGDLTFGLTEGMWNFEDTRLRNYALLYQHQWRELLPGCGFEAPSILTPGEPDRGGVSQQCLILTRRAETRHWLLAGGPEALAGALAASLSQAGERSTHLDQPGDIPSSAGFTDLVYLGAVEAADPADQEAVLAPALDLTQALAGRGDPPRVHLVTRGAQAAGGPVQPAQAGLLGFGRTLTGELPEVATRLIDLDPVKPAGEQVPALAAELRRGGRGEIALRGKDRRQPCLARLHPTPVKEVRFDPDASYLITGAFGGLGLEVAIWMAERGARHLVLAGRRPPSAAAEAVLERLRAKGATPLAVRCDLGEREQVRSLIETAGHPAPIKGVIHAAGALADAGLIAQTWNRFETVLKAKVHGSWHLHQLTAGLELDHFVLFSSAASLLGPAGQSNHAAANSFIDALAHARRAQGLPALAVDWGAWADVGAAAREGIDARVERSGLNHMAPSQALEALAWAMDSGELQVAVISADWAVYRQRFATGAAPTLLAGLLAERAPNTPPGPPREAPAAASLRRRLADTPALRRRDLLLDEMRGAAAKIMGLDDVQAIAEERPLRDLGLDSLMSVELRNALARALDAKLPATLLFDHPSLASLADFLADTLLQGLFEEARVEDELEGLDAAALSNLLAAELGDRP